MADLNCQVQIQRDELFAGQSFFLNCESGKELPQIKQEAVELRVDESQQDTLRLVEFSQKSDRLLQLKVVSFEAGEHQVLNAQLIDSENAFLLSPVQFTVSSLIDPQNPPKAPEGPMTSALSWPPLYFAGLAFVLILMMIPVVYRFYIFRKRKKLLSLQLQKQGGRNPAQFYFQNTRKIMRLISQERELDQALALLFENWLLYLATKTQVPTEGWGFRRFRNDLKKKISKQDLEKIKASWKELQFWSSAAKKKTQISRDQAESVLRSASSVVDRIETYEF